MFGFSKRKDKQQTEEKIDQAPQDSWLNRVKSGLGKTRDSFSSGMATALLGRKTLDEDTLEELEKG